MPQPVELSVFEDPVRAFDQLETPARRRTRPRVWWPADAELAEVVECCGAADDAAPRLVAEQAERVRAALAVLPKGKKGARQRAGLIAELEVLLTQLDELGGWDGC